VPAQEELDAMRTGILDMGHTCSAYNVALNPAFANFECVVGGMSSVQRIFWFKIGGGNELLAEGLSPFGVTLLSTAASTPEDWGYTTFPLKTLDDVKKLKMRTSGDGGEILARMGAATVNLPGGELYESMQRGVINAFEYAGASDAWAMGFHEVMDYLYVSLSRGPSDFNFFGARTESFNALPDDLKVIVKGMCESEALGFYVYTIPENAIALDKIIDYGVQVEKLPKEIEDELLKVAAEFYDEKAAKEDEYYRRVVTSQREFRRVLELQGIY
jgi:TRAP-type mannitol/chloroaromatic compound transport system substrate-binding protein